MLLPPEAACISFGHFLELALGLEGCLVHGRALHRSFARYFCIGSSLACFHYEHIAPNSVLLPPNVITYSCAAQQRWLEEEGEELVEVLHFSFASFDDSAYRHCVFRPDVRCTKKHFYKFYHAANE